MPKNKPIDNCTEICYYFLTMEYGMRNTQPQIMSRIAKRFGGSGAVVTAKDFLDLAGRDAVDRTSWSASADALESALLRILETS